jgi:hypothetical protein
MRKHLAWGVGRVARRPTDDENVDEGLLGRCRSSMSPAYRAPASPRCAMSCGPEDIGRTMRIATVSSLGTTGPPTRERRTRCDGPTRRWSGAGGTGSRSTPGRLRRWRQEPGRKPIPSSFEEHRRARTRSGSVDTVIRLSIGEETLRRRIETRTDNDFGKDPVDLEDILGWHASSDERMQSFGAILVDAERQLEVVVHEVLRVALRG